MIADCANEDNQLSRDLLIGIAYTTVMFLETFGIVRWRGELCQITTQIPTYFRNSFIWYLTNHQTLLSNWDKAGTADEVINFESLLDNAPYFLKLIENRRLILSQQLGIEPGCSRFETVAFDFIVAVDRGIRAQQFQLIGGRQKPNEDHFETAKRELQEELFRNELLYGRDYEITLLSKSPIEISDLSRTYGALTQYQFWLYSVTFKLRKLLLSESDRWISLNEIRSGITKDEKRVGDAEFYRLIDSKIPGGLHNLPSSIELGQVEDYHPSD
jgi:hypothetical protein